MAGVIDTLANAVSFRQVVLRDETSSFTCTDVVHKVQQLARIIRRAGYKRVGLHADNGAAWIFVDLACQEANVICVPLSLNPDAAQRTHVLNVSGVDAIFTSMPQLFADDFTQDEKFTELPLALMLKPSATGRALPDATSKISFTAGTTGNSKGVCLSADQQLAQGKAFAHAVQLQNPVHLCALPLSCLQENIAGVYATLQAGGTVIVRALQELGYVNNRLTEPDKFLHALDAILPDTLILTPALLQVLVQAVKDGWQPPLLKFITVSGGMVPAALIMEARALELPVYEAYGLAEGASLVCLNTPRVDQVGSCGIPLPHLNVQIENLEITISGAFMLGYAGEPASWKQSRVFTGDLGYMDDWGFLHATGRRKNLLFSSQDRNISPEWAESELMSSALFADVIVVGDSLPYCVALVAARNPQASDRAIDVAVAAANNRLPDYAQVKHWLRLDAPLAEDPELMLENGELRRDHVVIKYGAQIDSLYNSCAAIS